MIAARFKSVGWVAGVATAALGCYLVSQSVAAERAGLARIDAKIAMTRNDIHRLTTEIGTRGRMSQLDRWNREVLALQAPGTRQFAASEVQLAALNGPRALPIDPDIAATKGAVEKVAYTPAPPAAAAIPVVAAVAPSEPMLRPATYVRTKPDRLEVEAPAPIIKASLERKPERVTEKPAVEKPAVIKVAMVKPVRLSLDTSVAVEAPRKAAPKAKPASSGLLPLDIDSLVAAERKAKR